MADDDLDRESFTKRSHLIKEGYFTKKFDLGGEGAFASLAEHIDLIADPIFSERLMQAEEAGDAGFFLMLSDAMQSYASKMVKRTGL